ncbi:MAG: YebC/PmpR family DNA-binding transcriptional regulator [Candidatus Hydrogenedentota bacterium]
MSGHSKWSKIKRQKENQDAKKGKLFSKLAKEITIAAKTGGSGDINSNARLRLVVTKAREANMPMDNIKKAIARGTGELPGVNYEDIIYEGYGPGGIAIVVEAVTDNKNRITSEVRNIFSKHNGRLAERGAVAWNFKRRGVIIIKKSDKEEEILDVAINSGASDFEVDEDEIIIKTEFEDFEKVKKGLQDFKFEIKEADVNLVPDNYTEIDIGTAEKNMRLIEALEELDDINKVTTNMDIPEQILQKANL